MDLDYRNSMAFFGFLIGLMNFQRVYKLDLHHTKILNHLKEFADVEKDDWILLMSG
jgi:hypothetical protein